MILIKEMTSIEYHVKVGILEGIFSAELFYPKDKRMHIFEVEEYKPFLLVNKNAKYFSEVTEKWGFTLRSASGVAKEIRFFPNGEGWTFKGKKVSEKKVLIVYLKNKEKK